MKNTHTYMTRTALALALVASAGVLPQAYAGEQPCHKTMHAGHAGHHGSAGADDSASTKDLKKANDIMHKDMDIVYTNDADVDFLRGMIAHHQGAVEMANVQLKYGKDAQVKRLSQDIIRAQNIEIKWMKSRLAQLEGKPLTRSDTPTGSGTWTDSKWTGDKDVWFNAR